MKKMIYIALPLTAAAMFLLGGCAKASGNASGTSDQNQASENPASEDAASDLVPAFKDMEFPDAMPKNPTLAEESYYDYDDMSVPYELEFFTYNYGQETPQEDPIKDWLEKKYNVKLTLTTALQADIETVLSTRFSSGDVPDLITLPNAKYGFSLGSQGMLTDASELYPYMPQTSKFVTKALMKWSTMEDGTIPFVTKYAIQDGDEWGLAIRQDWLDAFGMEMPSTMDDILSYAQACVEKDPDGNGIADTYFMTGAASGKGFGMLDALEPLFGNPAEHVDNGILASPMLDGSTKEYISYIHKLYQMNTLAPDWFTTDWQLAGSYTMKDRIGMINHPSGALYQEYVTANDNDYTVAWRWNFPDKLPEGTKGSAGGNPGECFAIPMDRVKGDAGKLKRICHILDAMCYGGEAYFETVQDGGKEVYEGYTADVRQYNEDGSSYCYTDKSHPSYANNTSVALAPWQIFGYTLKWQKEYCPPDSSPEYKAFVDKINEGAAKLAEYERWPNDSMLSVISADLAPNLDEYVLAQEYKFITGERSFDQWDDFIQEYLDKGGLKVLEAKAKKLGCDLPAELK